MGNGKDFRYLKKKKKSPDRDNTDPFGRARNGIMEVNKGQFHESFGLKRPANLTITDPPTRGPPRYLNY